MGQEPVVSIAATGTVVIVEDPGDCDKPIQRKFLPSAEQPVRVVVQSMEKKPFFFPLELREGKSEFYVQIGRIGNPFTFHFYYFPAEATKYHTKEYDVLEPTDHPPLSNLPSPPVGQKLDAGFVCLSKEPKSFKSSGQLLWEDPDWRPYWGISNAPTLSNLTTPFRELSVPDSPESLWDGTWGSGQTEGTRVVSGKIVAYPAANPKVASGQQTAQRPEGVKGLRVTVSGGQNGSVATTYVNDGLSGDDGSYSIELKENPPSDFYLITVSGKGYETAVTIANSIGQQDDITVDRTADRPSQVASALAPNLDGAAKGGNFGLELIQALPLGIRRSVDSLALLLAGVAPAAQTLGPDGPRVSATLGSAGQFSSVGLRGTANDFLVDGTDNNDENVGARRQGYLIPGSQSVEAVSSSGVLTALYDSRYGRAPGAQVNSSTLSGGHQLHLTSYGLLTDQRFNAQNYFDGLIVHGSQALTVGGRPVEIDGIPQMTDPIGPTRLPDTEVTAGAVMNGSIPGLRDGFFTSSFEFDRVREVERSNFAVPTIAERGYSGTGATGLTGQFNNSYPATLAGDAFFSLYPFPNNPVGPYGANTYTRDRTANAQGLRASQRVDRTLPLWGTSSLGIRYSYETSNTQIPVTGGALDSGLNVQSQPQSLAAFLSSTLRPSLTNTLRLSWGNARFRFLGDRDSSLVPSNFMPGDSFLLNTPVFANTTLSGAGPVTFMKQGLGNTEGVIGPVGQLNIAGYSSVGTDQFAFPQRRADSTFQLANVVSGRHGRQIFTAGAEGWLILLNSNVNQNARPTVSFYGEPLAASNTAPARHFGALMDPASLAAIGLEGNVYQTFTTSTSTALHLYRPQLDLFLQDDVQVTRSLAVNVGFRFSLNGAPTSSRFADAYGPNGTLVSELNSALQACIPTHGQAFCNNAYGFLQKAFPPGFDQVYRAEPLGYNPRVGLAWDPFGYETTAIRLGGGVYSGQLPAEIISESSGLFPQSLPLLYASGSGTHFANYGARNSPIPFTGLNTLSQGANVVNILNTFLSASSSTPLGSELSAAQIVSVEPGAGLKNPEAYEFGLAIDQSLSRTVLLSVGYVGTLAHDLPQVNAPNALTPQTLFLSSANLGLPCQRPLIGDCPAFDLGQGGHLNLADPTVYSSTANSEYQSLQAQLRISRAWLQASSAFTWSHSIDDSSDLFDTLGSFALPQNPRDLGAERASSNFDIRLRSVSYFVANSIFHHSWLAKWQLSSILTLETGPPFTVNTVYDLGTSPFNGSLNGLDTERLETTMGLIGPGVGIGAPGISRQTRLAFSDPNLERPAAQTAHFLCQPYPCYGAVGRNTFRAAGIENLDVALSRSLALRGALDGHNIQLRLEGYNVLNRTNFSIPVRILEEPGFGSSVSTVGNNRRLQLVLKYSF